MFAHQNVNANPGRSGIVTLQKKSNGTEKKSFCILQHILSFENERTNEKKNEFIITAEKVQEIKAAHGLYSPKKSAQQTREQMECALVYIVCLVGSLFSPEFFI